MFKYLLRLRRAARALDEAWVALRRLAAAAATTTPGALRAEEEREARRRRRLRLHGADVGTAAPNAAEACQRARRDVAFLVRNWLTYLQTDVVEAQFREMMDAIDATTKDENGVDFGQAQRAHRAFLAALGAQSFLDLPSVTQSVEATLAMARTVCGAIATLPLDGSQGPDESRVAAEMERARQAFDATSRDLYDTLRSDRLAGDPKAPYLRRLLLRLNFNGFMGDKADAARRREKVAGPTNAQVPDAGIGRDRKGSEGFGGFGVSENTAPSALSAERPERPARLVRPTRLGRVRSAHPRAVVTATAVYRYRSGFPFQTRKTHKRSLHIGHRTLQDTSKKKDYVRFSSRARRNRLFRSFALSRPRLALARDARYSRVSASSPARTSSSASMYLGRKWSLSIVLESRMRSYASTETSAYSS
jgi:hypothetical protein